MADEHLRVLVGMAPDTRFAVDGELLIGRAATEADGRLGNDPELSRRHAQLARGPEGELTIEDLGSSNGTFVNGERLEGVRVLQLGDVVRLGTTELAVTDADGHIPEPTQIGSPAVTHVPIPQELGVVEGLAKGERLTLDGRAATLGGGDVHRARRERRGTPRRRSRALPKARPPVPRGGSDRGGGP